MNADQLENAWSEMTVAGGFRRVDLTHPIDWYIGLGRNGNPAFMLMSTAQPPSLRPSSSLDITKRRRVGMDDRWTLTFELMNPEFMPVFSELCANLMRYARNADTDQEALQKVIRQYRRWDALFRRGAPRRMSEEQRQTLLAHLLYLRMMIESGISFADALAAWIGPLGDDQDFRISDRWAVVKPHSTSNTGISISSLDELGAEPPGTLMLMYLLPGGPAQTCITLSQIIDELYMHSEPADAGELFAERLAQFGYIPNREADNRAYVFSGCIGYDIDDTFPRLTAPSVPRGISAASYNIDLAAIDNWKNEKGGLL